jgi:hypothetical protein
VDVVAHRGLTYIFPENSRAAVMAAVAAGVSLVEVDVRATRDGGLFFLHDATLDRTTDAVGRLSALTSSQASRVRLTDGSELPRLETILDLLKPGAKLCLDVKDEEEAEPLLSAVSWRPEQVEIWSQHQSVVSRTARCGLSAVLISMGLFPRGIGEFLWRARDAGAVAVSFFPADLEPHIARACHHGSMPFLCGTPNDEGTWRYLARVGARAAITDRPLECRRLFAPPQPRPAGP